MNKRIAICISGHFRTYEKTYPEFWRNILAPLRKEAQVDIFISSWNNREPEKGWHIPEKKNSEPLNFSDIYQKYNPILDDFFDEYMEKHRFNLRNFTDKTVEPSRIFDGEMLFSTPMFWQISNANALKTQYELRNNFTYDLVIRYRPDQTFTAPINLDILNHPDKLCVLNVDTYHDRRHVDDTFFSGPSEIMDKACSFYYNLVNIFDKCSFTPFGPEALFGLHLDLVKVPLRVVRQEHILVR